MTGRPAARLRQAPRVALAWVAVALSALGLTASAAGARSAAVRVLVATTVSDAAHDSMSRALWATLVENYVGAETVPFSGHPTLADCHAAKAAYMVDAPFELRPRLPGVANSEGRVAALTHVVVTNCVTTNIVFDRVILLDSDPPGSSSAGDFESVPEISWSKVVPAELGRYPLFFPHVARIASVRPPFAYIALNGTPPLKIGDQLRAFANSNGDKRDPVILTVTSSDARYMQVLFSNVGGDPVPQPGDYVEPMTATPSPSPPPSAAPSRPSPSAPAASHGGRD